MNRNKVFNLSEEVVATIAVIVSTIFVGIILAVLIIFFDLHDHIGNLLEWINNLGVWAPIIFILLDMIIVIVLFPGVLVTMGAGFIFGVVKGSIYVVIATTLGAIIAFLIARFLFSKRMTEYFLSHHKVLKINQYLDVNGWKFVLATRLVPFFPFKLSNYLFGLTKFKFSSFLTGTFLGIWPNTIFNVYVGSLAANLSNIGDLSETQNDIQFYAYIFGFLFTIIAITYIGRLAKNALNKYAMESKIQDPDSQK